jgi:hypothetical protein
MEAQAQPQDATIPRIASEPEESAAREARRSEATRREVEHPELEAMNQKLQKGFDAKVEEVRADRRLNKAEARAQITDLWNRVSDYHERMLKAHESGLEDRAAEQEKAVFYVSGTQQDSVRSAYNDLYARTSSSGDADSRIHAREELQRQWERAVRTGDNALMTAVGHLATEKGWEGQRDKWLATSQERTEAWQRYGEARTKLANWKDPQARMLGRLTGKWSLAKPPEA